MERNLRGYGEHPPFADWPDGARVAVSLVLNVEEGSERAVYHGDPANESSLSEMVGGRHGPGERDLGIESVYEYGSRAGFWRLLRMFTDRGLPATAYACAMALEMAPGWFERHGVKAGDKLGLPPHIGELQRTAER